MSESQSDITQCYDIYVAFGRRQFPCDPIHSLIVLTHAGAERCIRLHCEGWEGNWNPAIESNKRFNSWWIESKYLVGRIPATAGPTVQEEARAIPAQCAGRWASYLLLRLEQKELVPAGTYEYWKAHIPVDSNAGDLGLGAPVSDRESD